MFRRKYIPKWTTLNTRQSEKFQRMFLKEKKYQTCSDTGDFLKWLVEVNAVKKKYIKNDDL